LGSGQGNVQLGDRRRGLVGVIAATVAVAAIAVTLATIGQPDAGPESRPLTGRSAQPTTTRPSPTSIETTATLAFAPRASPTTPEDEALAARFMELAASPDRERIQALPLADRVLLGLGTTLLADRGSEELEDLAGWTVDGYGWPTSLLEVVGTSTVGTVTLVGDHPRCLSPPLPPPPELADLRRVVIEPDPAAVGSCVLWWRIELYVSPGGEVVAVTQDQWEW
jgi:hypothetical protein